MQLKVQKKEVISIFLLLFLIVSSGFIPNSGDNKVALIIAINDYPNQEEGFGWSAIAADRDAEYLKKTLQRQGFSKNNIHTISNEEASKENILKSLHETLPKLVKKGGLCLIHFSTHGQQIFDQNEDEIDGLDEAIVTYRAQRKYKKGVYEGTEHLRDEEIKQALHQLRKRLGPTGQLLINFDACHSGTGLRNKNLISARGASEILAPEDFLKTKKKISVKGNFELSDNNSELAPIIAIYASGPDELNYQILDQGKQIGSLTYAFCQAFSEADSKTSYRMLFDRVRQIMFRKVPRQTPQIEGNLNQLVMGGRLDGVPIYYRLSKKIDAQHFKINQGIFQGLSVGSVIGCFGNEIHDPKNMTAIVGGKVVESDLTSAIIELDRPLKKNRQDYEQLKVFILEKSYTSPLKISIDQGLPPPSQTYFNNQLEKHPVFLQNEYPDLLIKQSQNRISLEQADGKIILESSKKEEIWSECFNFYIADFMRKIESKRSYLKADLKLIPIHADPSIAPTGEKLSKQAKLSNKTILDEQGNYRLYPKQNFRFQVSNPGTQNLYYAVIEVNPKNKTKLVVPACDNMGYCYFYNELKIAPGQTHTYAINYEITNITGTHFLKLITSPNPIQIQEAIQTRNESIDFSNVDNSFNHLLQIITAQKQKKENELIRSKGQLTIPTRNINIETILYRVEINKK